MTGGHSRTKGTIMFDSDTPKIYPTGNSIETTVSTDRSFVTIIMCIDNKPRFYIEYNAEQLDVLITMLQNDRKNLIPLPQLN